MVNVEFNVCYIFDKIESFFNMCGLINMYKNEKKKYYIKY